MIATKIATIAFATLLLLPIAITFFAMWTFPEHEVSAEQDQPPPVVTEGDEHGATAVVMGVASTMSSVSPFSFSNRVFSFGPRKWAGITGLIATLIVWILLLYCAIFPRYESHSISYIRYSGTEPDAVETDSDDHTVDWKDYDLDSLRDTSPERERPTDL